MALREAQKVRVQAQKACMSGIAPGHKSPALAQEHSALSHKVWHLLEGHLQRHRIDTGFACEDLSQTPWTLDKGSSMQAAM